jgi:anti-sigma regulatory factor (Ser/Thr protein kinase)
VRTTSHIGVDETLVELAGEHCAPAEARAAVSQFLSNRSLHVLDDAARLLTSELVTNAVVHAQTAFTIRMCVEGTRFRVEVADGRPGGVEMVGSRDESGRGLRIVDAVSDRWGWENTANGKVVWFELRTVSVDRGRAQHRPR